MTTKEISKEIKDYFKPMVKTNNLKLSIRTEPRLIEVSIIEFNEQLINDDEFFNQYGYKQVNYFCIKDSSYLTIAAKTLFGMILQIINKYHYDRSDAMTDYFDTNFYIRFNVGNFERPFKLAS